MKQLLRAEGFDSLRRDLWNNIKTPTGTIYHPVDANDPACEFCLFPWFLFVFVSVVLICVVFRSCCFLLFLFCVCFLGSCLCLLLLLFALFVSVVIVCFRGFSLCVSVIILQDLVCVCCCLSCLFRCSCLFGFSLCVSVVILMRNCICLYLIDHFFSFL